MSASFHTELTTVESITSSWPLIKCPMPMVAAVTAYLTFSKSIGPKLMRNRKPMDVTTVMMVYNIVQVALSAWMVYLSTSGFGVFVSLRNRFSYIHSAPNYITNGFWWYLVAKVTELLDTAFMVLRKKDNQISFLHLYHHSLMPIIVWIMIKYFPGDHLLITVLFNSIVHVIMYTYYFLAGLGPGIQKYLWWKKYITLLQLLQFSAAMVYHVLTFFVDTECQKTPLVIDFALGFIFVCLFGSFYASSYAKKLKST